MCFTENIEFCKFQIIGIFVPSFVYIIPSFVYIIIGSEQSSNVAKWVIFGIQNLKDWSVVVTVIIECTVQYYYIIHI